MNSFYRTPDFCSTFTALDSERMRLCGESTCLPQQNTFHARITTDPTVRKYNTNLTCVSLSDSDNVLPAETLFRNGQLVLSQERCMNAPAEFRQDSIQLPAGYPQRLYAPYSRPIEQLDVLVDSTEFIIPTGGISSSNAQCEYDWDIYVDNNYYKTFRGYSGRQSTGIKIIKPKSEVTLRDDVFLYREQDTINIRHDFSTSIPIKAPRGYRILPFYVQETSTGAFNKCVLGTPSNVSIASDASSIKVTYTAYIEADADPLDIPRLWQYIAVCPHGNNLTRPDIKTYLLYASVPDLWDKITDVHELIGGSSCVVNFAANVLHERSFIPCTGVNWVMPIAGYAPCYPKRYPKQISPRQMLVTIRPNALYPPQQAWLRGFGFNANSESYETWNRQENKDLLLKVAGVLTPEMVCDESCTHAGHHTFRSWFDGCTNLQQADLVFDHTWANVKQCGDYFGFRMFANCARLIEFNPNWSEPLGFETVGQFHNVNKYLNCASLTKISESYNESPNIAEAGAGYGSYQFAGCGQLVSPGRHYTEPVQFENTPPAITSYKFENCANLVDFTQYTETRIPGAYPQAYLAGKFDGCPKIKNISPLYRLGNE